MYYTCIYFCEIISRDEVSDLYVWASCSAYTPTVLYALESVPEYLYCLLYTISLGGFTLQPSFGVYIRSR